ncbi:hypothetical protein ACHAPE_009331 [Trichoderma viride]
MSNNRRVQFDLSSDDGVQSPQPSGNRTPPPSYHHPSRVIHDLGVRRSNCECQKYRMNDPADEWDQYKTPPKMESLMEMASMRPFNYESGRQFGKINNSNAMVTREAATEEDFRVESGEEAFDAFNASVGFTEFGSSFEIEGSRIRKQFTTTETTRRRTNRDTYGSPSQSAYHVSKKVDTVELQTWFEGEDCFVAASDAGISRGNMRRETHRSWEY